jgi:hypothetical protein
VRSRADAHLAVVHTIAIAVLSLGAARAQEQSARTSQESPDPAQIARAIQALKADPNLATERTVKVLRLKGNSTALKPDTPESRNPGTSRVWIAGLSRWLNQSARVLVWCAAAMVAALVVVSIVQRMRRHGLPRDKEAFVRPTHVRSLDIRPESLPRDLGAAALMLWERGDHRAALALLYRGLLSRLAHDYGVPIRESTTEQGCLALASSHLTPERRAYAARVVGVWQQFVYGGHSVEPVTMYALCKDFASLLGAASPAEPVVLERAV